MSSNLLSSKGTQDCNPKNCAKGYVAVAMLFKIISMKISKWS